MADWASFDCFYNSTVPGSEEVASIKCIEPVVVNLIGALVALGGVGLFIMLIVGGFNFLFSGGDQKKLEMARGTITNAVIGLVVIISAFIILRTIGVFTGLESRITRFEIPK